MRENRPKDTISRVEMRIVISKVTMGEKEDPSKLNKNLRALQNRYPGKIEENDLVAVILQQAPGKYAAALTMMQRMASRLLPP